MTPKQQRPLTITVTVTASLTGTVATLVHKVSSNRTGLSKALVDYTCVTVRFPSRLSIDGLTEVTKRMADYVLARHAYLGDAPRCISWEVQTQAQPAGSPLGGEGGVSAPDPSESIDPLWPLDKDATIGLPPTTAG